MRKPYYLLLAGVLSLVCLTRCSHPDTSKAVFKPDALPPFSVEIDVTRDTVLRAPGGSLIHIPANALDAGAATTVRLVIREALHMSDMIRAGLLTTTSEGKMLGSGGMIDIEAAEGQTVSVKKPISISIPATYLEKGMQLFRGERDASGNLVWNNPVPLSPSVDSNLARLDIGKAIFTTNCTSCHAFGKTILGSDLAYIGQRRDRLWLFNFTKNNKTVLRSGDRLANCIYWQYNKTQMNTFPALTDADLDALYAFIDNESYRLDLPFPEDRLKHCLDSCGYKPDLASIANDTLPISQPKYYEVIINDLGWFNTDRFLEGKEGVKLSELTVTIPKKYIHTVNVYLIIPSSQVFQDGSIDGEGSCIFHGSRQIDLPRGVPMQILAMGQQGDQSLLGTAIFLSAEKQTITLKIDTVAKDKVNAFLRQFDRLPPQQIDTPSIVQPIPGNAVPAGKQMNNNGARSGKKTISGAGDCNCGCPGKV